MKKHTSKLDPFEIMRQVKIFCESHKIAPKPTHYAVIYEHINHSHENLSAAIERQIKQRAVFDDFFMSQLHDEHIVSKPHDIEQQVSGMDKIINSLLGDIQSSSDSIDTFSDALNEGASELQKNPEAENLKLVVAHMLEASAQAIEEHSLLTDKLNAAETNTKTLQDELAQTQADALNDPLTGLLNRRGLRQRLPKLTEGNEGNCLVVFDIDHFKKFNDDFGHLLGDKVLQVVAKQIKHCVRDNDIAVRFGGEEMLAILPNIGLKEGIIAADSMRKKIANLKLTNNRTQETIPSVTVSGGIAIMNPQESWEDWMERADQALYIAKNNGRNQIQVAK